MPRPSLRHQVLVRASAGTMALRGTSLVLGFLSTLVLARALGVRDYGIVALVTAWVTMLQLASVLGLDRLVVRNVSVYMTRGRPGALRGLLRRGTQAVALAGLILALLCTAAAFLLFDSTESDQRTAFALGFVTVPIAALLTLRGAALQGFGRVVAGRTGEDLWRPLTFLVLVLSFFLLPGLDLTASLAVGLQLAAAVVALTISTLLLRRTVPADVQSAAHQYETRIWMTSGFSLLLVSGSVLVMTQADIVLLGSILGPEEAGVYAAAVKFASLVTLIAFGVNTAVAPVLARLHAEGETTALQRTLTQSARGMMALTLVGALAVALTSEWLLGLLGPGFKEGSTAMALLSIGYVVNAAAGSNGEMLMMGGRERYAARGVGIGAIANIALNLALIPLWGVEGAAIATVLSTTLWNVLLTIAVRRELGLDPTIVGVPLRG